MTAAKQAQRTPTLKIETPKGLVVSGATVDDLLAALREIAAGTVNYRPGHVNYDDNRTKAEIGDIARAAIARAEV